MLIYLTPQPEHSCDHRRNQQTGDPDTAPSAGQKKHSCYFQPFVVGFGKILPFLISCDLLRFDSTPGRHDYCDDFLFTATVCTAEAKFRTIFPKIVVV